MASVADFMTDRTWTLEKDSELDEIRKSAPEYTELFDLSVPLEGMARHISTHAAGVVIGNRPLWEHVPCFRADGKIVTQYTMVDAEKAGLVKFDFLGLKTLTIIDWAVRIVNAAGEGDPLAL